MNFRWSGSRSSVATILSTDTRCVDRFETYCEGFTRAVACEPFTMSWTGCQAVQALSFSGLRMAKTRLIRASVISKAKTVSITPSRVPTRPG